MSRKMKNFQNFSLYHSTYFVYWSFSTWLTKVNINIIDITSKTFNNLYEKFQEIITNYYKLIQEILDTPLFRANITINNKPHTTYVGSIWGNSIIIIIVRFYLLYSINKIFIYIHIFIYL